MRRHMPRLLLTGALLSPVTLHALGLGEIRLNSALNQPFNAEIELLSPTTEDQSICTVNVHCPPPRSLLGTSTRTF